MRSWRVASSAIASRSPRVRTPPVGLAGELITTSGSGGDERRQLVDIEAELSVIRIGIGTGLPPTKRTSDS